MAVHAAASGSSPFFSSFPTEGFRLAAEVVNRLLQYALLQRAMSEAHTPGPSNGSRATFAAPGGVRILYDAADSVLVHAVQ